MSYKIIVAHPGRQHSYRLVSALKKRGMLECYVTTIYDKDSSLLMKMVKKVLSEDNRKRARGRKNADLLDTDVIQYCKIGGMIEAFLARVDKSRNLYRRMQRWDADRFGVKAAKFAVKKKADAVIMYDTNAMAGFEYLKKHAPDIVRIQDVSSPARPYVKEIYQREIENSGRYDLKDESRHLWNDKLLQRLQLEIENTQYFLSASGFVRESLEYCGVKESQIKIVPYGANVSSTIQRKGIDEFKKIEFLFVGQVVYRKGITYLLDSMARCDEKKANLTVTGAYHKDDWFIEKNKYKENITFTGMVTFDRMREIYEKADVFVLPSFCEGMSQVGIEAMACGLPIICTFNSGVSDLVKDGVNGFVIPAGDADALYEKMAWFLKNPQKIAEMGEEARKAAKKYTWDYYGENIVNAITEVMDGELLQREGGEKGV